MPMFGRVSDTFDRLSETMSPHFRQAIESVYNGLSNNEKNTLSNQLSIGSTMAKGDHMQAQRRDERVRRLLAALLTEGHFGKFGHALMRVAMAHAKAHDHWDVERIMVHTYIGIQSELPGLLPAVTLPKWNAWIGARDMYANSCGGWASMLLTLLARNRDETLWTQHVDNTQLTRDVARTHITNTLNTNWMYCYVRLGCHAWVFERTGGGAANLRNVQVWSNMNVEEMGFNYAYSLDKGWGRTVRSIADCRQAMHNLINNTNTAAACRMLIPDPEVTWGISPNAGGAGVGRVNLRLATLAQADVAPDLQTNITWQMNSQITDYRNNGLNIPDA
ncbi:hypothetical protein CYFUS_000202 [Cystobacter fuscus]|uniref:Uncharacterized protein n=1 Tax=Cystobacter fuscus TaxID=43 RepID=A0A250ISR0_9BACT|nr:hypothetical protein [Cystobacter fuscus]ATB34795.1 hypothetical protein CYFUS_000202 [Cystobacter fuscus]